MFKIFIFVVAHLLLGGVGLPALFYGYESFRFWQSLVSTWMLTILKAAWTLLFDIWQLRFGVKVQRHTRIFRILWFLNLQVLRHRWLAKSLLGPIVHIWYLHVTDAAPGERADLFFFGLRPLSELGLFFRLLTIVHLLTKKAHFSSLTKVGRFLVYTIRAFHIFIWREGASRLVFKVRPMAEVSWIVIWKATLVPIRAHFVTANVAMAMAHLATETFVID